MYLTRADIRDRVRVLVGDSSFGPVPTVPVMPTMFTQEAYNRFINDAYKDVYNAMPFCEIEELVNAVASTATYETQEVALIKMIDFNGLPLEFITAETLDRLDEKWRTRTSDDVTHAVLSDGSDWGIRTEAGQANEFRLYPIPETNDTQAIRVIGTWNPLPLYSDHVMPAMPGYLHDAIVFEAAARVLESSVEERNDGLAAAYRALRDWYIEQGMQRLTNRYPTQVLVMGEYTRRPRTLARDTHVPYTGIAPGDPE